MSDTDDDFTAEEVAMNLGLTPHPDGGYYRVLPHQEPHAEQVASYRLLLAQDDPQWVPMEAEEMWTAYMGSTLVLEIATGGPVHTETSMSGEGHWMSAPAGAWVRLIPQGPWTLAGRIAKPDRQLH